MAVIPEFNLNSLEQISQVLGSAVTGSQITNLFRQCSIHEVVGEAGTKWKRIYHSLEEKQKNDRCGNNVASFIQAVMDPIRFSSHESFERDRESLNTKLAFCGMQLGEDGKLRIVDPAKTIPDAEKRASELKRKLQDRNIHPEVLKYCRAELLQDNYFHAVFEATKGVAQYIRDKTGLTSDGAKLIDEAFSLQKPLLAFNTLQTESEQSEHKGFANLLKGFFGAIRNPLAHTPKIMWDGVIEAVDYLTLASMLMRKLEQAIVVKLQ